MRRNPSIQDFNFYVREQANSRMRLDDDLANTFVAEFLSAAAIESTYRNRLLWRRRWDSNPRDGFPSTPLAGERLRPLGHVSADPSNDMGAQGQGGKSCEMRWGMGKALAARVATDVS
jgi:hypothetical protein